MVHYSILLQWNLVSRNTRDRKMRSPYPEFVLTNIICIEKALKGTEIVFILTRFYCICVHALYQCVG